MNTKQIVLDHYIINRTTMALLAVANIDYSTIVFEGDDVFYVKKPCFKIIEESCLPSGSTYQGRRKAAIHETGAKRKVPIAINTHEYIYAIPTHSPENYYCNWLFYDHIQNISKSKNSNGKCVATFINGKEIELGVSLHVMQKQLYRTSHCMKVFSGR